MVLRKQNLHSVLITLLCRFSHACRLLTQPHSPRKLCLLDTHNSRTVALNRSLLCPLEHQAFITHIHCSPGFWATCQAQQHKAYHHSTHHPSLLLATWRDPVTRRQRIHCDQGPYSRSLPPGQHDSSPGAVPARAGL